MRGCDESEKKVEVPRKLGDIRALVSLIQISELYSSKPAGKVNQTGKVNEQGKVLARWCIPIRIGESRRPLLEVHTSSDRSKLLLFLRQIEMGKVFSQ